MTDQGNNETIGACCHRSTQTEKSIKKKSMFQKNCCDLKNLKRE